MKIFFLMRNSVYLRNFEPLIRALADKGHHVLLGFIKIDEICPEMAIAELADGNTQIDYLIFSKRTWMWRKPADFIRVLQTYARFLDRRYKDSVKLRARADDLLPVFIRYLVRLIVGHNESKRWLFIRFLRRLENAIPIDPFITHFLDKYRPDVFLITPLIDLHAKQLDWLKAAKSLGVASGLCVASWDNLSNKSLIQAEPDAVFVWNNIQKHEAVELHRIPSSKVVITGAQCYDRFFGRQPHHSKNDFYIRLGLEKESEYLLYLCSSKFIAPYEVGFVKEWVQRLRNSADPLLSRIGVVVRPHPQNASQWEKIDLSDLGNVTVYPSEGANPIRGNNFDDYFDSIYFSVATVGINTSAMIESGILKKPVFTILSPKFKTTQGGTLHFHHLVEGGLLNVSRGLDEHFEQLRNVLSDREAYQTRIRQFIKRFVRPNGLTANCTAIFVKSVESLSQKKIPNLPNNYLVNILLRFFMYPWAFFSYIFKMKI